MNSISTSMPLERAIRNSIRGSGRRASILFGEKALKFLKGMVGWSWPQKIPFSELLWRPL
jgi:hypothetical protein